MGSDSSRCRRHDRGLATYRLVRHKPTISSSWCPAPANMPERETRHTQPLADLLRQLNLALRGWTTYFRHGVSR